MTPLLTMRKQRLAAALLGLGLRLFLVWRFPVVTGDVKIYEELARNWLDLGTYGLFVSGQLIPVDIRVPGYPAFLAAIYTVLGGRRLAVLLTQAVLDLATCFLAAVLAARLAPKPSRSRVAVATLWLAVLCPFVANYAAAPLTEVLATFLTALGLLVLLTPWTRSDPCIDDQYSLSSKTWFLGGFIVGLGTLVRPETPLILAAVVLVLAVRWGRPSNWQRPVGSSLCMAAGLLLTLVPWAARNWRTLGRVQFLAPRYAELPGEYVPRGFYAWTKTWLVRYRDVYTLWKLQEVPISVEDFPASAFDSDAERDRVAKLFEQYNETLSTSPEWDREFARLARERITRRPLRTYISIPLGRAATLWFTPRIELLPYSGHLWPPGQKWEEDPVDFLVTLGFGLLNFLYVGLALVGAWRFRRQPGVAVLMAFIFIRTAFFTQVETPEPRYTLVCFPAVWGLAGFVWSKGSGGATPERPEPKQKSHLREMFMPH